MQEHRNGLRGRFPCRAFAGTILCVWLVLFFALLPDDVKGAEKITIGAVEEVILFPWGVKVPARVDTGAATSSLDVCGFAVEGKVVNFTLSDRCGGHRVRLPLIKMRHIQSTEGDEIRPVVEIEICLGSRRMRSQVTLNDRSRLDFPFLVGRNIIEGNFIVDVSLSKTRPPNCGESESPAR